MADRIVVMDKGVIQQFDTPQVLYNKPANMFVAGFIGSPQMNFIDAIISEENGKLKADFSSYKLEIPKEKTTELGKYKGRNIILGIRPEHILSADESNSKGKCALTVTAEIAETTGSETNIYFNLAGKRHIARIRSEEKISSGNSIRLFIDPDNVHFFDPETTFAI